MFGLKFVETETSSFLEEVVSEAVVEENMTTSDALNIGMTNINLNLISEDDFYYSTLNHKYPTPHQFPHPLNLKNTFHSLLMNPLMFRIN